MEADAVSNQLDFFDGYNVTLPDKLTILHVSDFHFHTRRKREQEIVVEALLNDLKTLCIGHRKPDIIIFSGDLTQGPPSDTHAEAYDILLEPIQKATNVSNERMFIVAGNHDVERDVVAKYLSEHEAWRADSNDMDKMNAAFEKGEFNEVHLAKFANYLDLENYMSKDSQVFSNIFCSVYHIEALNTDVVVLNSSMLSTGGLAETGDDEGKLTIPEYAIRDAMAHLKAGAFRVFTTHHPLRAFTETGGKYLSRELQKSANVHLFGHMHDPLTESIVGLQGSVVMNQAGAVFTKRNGWYIGYALMCVDRTKGFYETILRTYYPDRSEFDDAIDKQPGGRFYNSNEARQYWRSLASPVDDASFKRQLSGQVLETLLREWNELGLIEQSGRQHFVAPRLNKIEPASATETKVKIDAPLPFRSLTDGHTNLILYSPQEYGRTTLLREVQFEMLATADTVSAPRLPIMIRFDEIGQNVHNMTRVIRSRSLIDTQEFETDSLLALGLVCILIDDVVFEDHKRMTILRAFISKYPQCRYIFASLKNSAAPYGTLVVTQTPVRFEFAELCELKRKEMRELVKLKVLDADDVEFILDRLHAEISEINLPYTAANGTILMTIYEQNSNFRAINRSVLIEQFVDATLRKGAVEQSRRETFDYSNKTSLLAHIAGWMAKENCYTPTHEDLRATMKSYIDNLGLVANLDELLTEFLSARIMRKLPEDRLSFRYRAVLEYFIATLMIESSDFKEWVLDDARYLTYINELHYYAGKVRSDNRLMELVSERFQSIIAEFQGISAFDPLQLQTVGLPRKGSAESLGQLTQHLLGQPLTKEERDEALEADIPRDVEERQTVFRPRIEHPGHRLLVGLLLFSGVVKNMEQINGADKKRHLKVAWKGWSMLLSSSLSVVSELAKHRQMKINGVLYEFFAPRAMPDEELGRRIALGMPTSISRLIAANLGTEKLQLQLIEPDLDEANDPLIYEFFRSALIADLRLAATPAAIKAAVQKMQTSDFLSEALIWKVADLRRMDHISQAHFEAIQAELAETIVRLGGAKPSEIAKDKSRQIERFKKEGLMLKIQRQKDDA